MELYGREKYNNFKGSDLWSSTKNLELVFFWTFDWFFESDRSMHAQSMDRNNCLRIDKSIYCSKVQTQLERN